MRLINAVLASNVTFVLFYLWLLLDIRWFVSKRWWELNLNFVSESTCTFPSNFWSTAGQDAWLSSEMGEISFTSTTILNWKVHTFGTFTLTCELNSGTKYVMRYVYSITEMKYSVSFKMTINKYCVLHQSKRTLFRQLSWNRHKNKFRNIDIYGEIMSLALQQTCCVRSSWLPRPHGRAYQPPAVSRSHTDTCQESLLSVKSGDTRRALSS